MKKEITIAIAAFIVGSEIEALYKSYRFGRFMSALKEGTLERPLEYDGVGALCDDIIETYPKSVGTKFFKKGLKR